MTFKVTTVDKLRALGIDPLRGRAKEGIGWKKRDYKFYCLECHLEITKPYLCKRQRRLNKTVFSPRNPNVAMNAPPSLTPRCPQCKYANLLTRDERIQQMQDRIDNCLKEHKRVAKLKRKWKKFRSNHNNFPNLYSKHLIKGYKEYQMFEPQIELRPYLEEELFLPRENQELAECMRCAYELFNQYETCKTQMDKAMKLKHKALDEMRKQEFEPAVEHYNDAICARIDCILLYALRAEAYLEMRQYVNCIRDCTLGIDIHDQISHRESDKHAVAQALICRAKAYKGELRLAEAKTDLERALELRKNRMNREANELLEEVNKVLTDGGDYSKIGGQSKASDSKEDEDDDESEESANDGNKNTNNPEANPKPKPKLDHKFMYEYKEDPVINVNTFLKRIKEGTANQEMFITLHKFVRGCDSNCNQFDLNAFEALLKYVRHCFKNKTFPTIKFLNLMSTVNYIAEFQDTRYLLKETQLEKIIPILVLYIFTYYHKLSIQNQQQCMRFVDIVLQNNDNISRIVITKHAARLLNLFMKLQTRNLDKEKEKLQDVDPENNRLLYFNPIADYYMLNAVKNVIQYELINYDKGGQVMQGCIQKDVRCFRTFVFVLKRYLRELEQYKNQGHVVAAENKDESVESKVSEMSEVRTLEFYYRSVINATLRILVSVFKFENKTIDSLTDDPKLIGDLTIDISAYFDDIRTSKGGSKQVPHLDYNTIQELQTAIAQLQSVMMSKHSHFKANTNIIS